MRSFLTLLTVSTLLAGTTGAASADPAAPRLSLLPAADAPDDVDTARTMRAAGIGLFVGGLAITVVSQGLLAAAVTTGWFEGGQASLQTEIRRVSFTISSAVTVVAGNAMLAAGLGLWGTARGRLKAARSRGQLGFAPVPGGASSSLTVHF